MGWFHKYLCCHLRRHYSQLESVVIELRTCIGVCCCAIGVQIPKTVFYYTSREVVKILEQVLDVCDNFKTICVLHSFSNIFYCHISYPAMQTVYNSYSISSSVSWPSACFCIRTELQKMTTDRLSWIDIYFSTDLWLLPGNPITSLSWNLTISFFCKNSPI